MRSIKTNNKKRKPRFSKEKALKRSIPYETLSVHWLQDPAYAKTFLKTLINEFNKHPDLGALLTGLRHLAKASGGMTKLANHVGLNREHLYRALSPSGNPTFSTVLHIMEALGMRIKFERTRSSFIG